MTTEKLKKDITCHNGRLAWQTKSALTHQASAKGGQIQDSEREAIQLIKKTGLEKQNAIPLFPYSLVNAARLR